VNMHNGKQWTAAFICLKRFLSENGFMAVKDINITVTTRGVVVNSDVPEPRQNSNFFVCNDGISLVDVTSITVS
jgi:hypothetical protein